MKKYLMISLLAFMAFGLVVVTFAGWPVCSTTKAAGAADLVAAPPNTLDQDEDAAEDEVPSAHDIKGGLDHV